MNSILGIMNSILLLSNPKSSQAKRSSFSFFFLIHQHYIARSRSIEMKHFLGGLPTYYKMPANMVGQPVLKLSYPKSPITKSFQKPVVKIVNLSTF